MIIAFDGNVFTGKSSLIKALSSLTSAVIIDEHGIFLDGHIPSHLVKDRVVAMSLQLHYFEAEERRSKYLETHRYNLLDRSFVSMAAHVLALVAVRDIDIREWFLAEIEKRLTTRKIIIPDIFYFVRCSHDIIRQRALMDPLRGTDYLYYEERYLTIVDHFNEVWSKHIGGVVIDTDVIAPIRLAQNLARQKYLSSLERRSNQQICDSLRDVFTHRGKQDRG